MIPRLGLINVTVNWTIDKKSTQNLNDNGQNGKKITDN